MSRLRRNLIFSVAGQAAMAILSLVSARAVYAKLGGDYLGIIYFTIALNTLFVAQRRGGGQ